MRTLILSALFLLISAGTTAAHAQDNPPDSVARRPMFTPFDKRPELKNRREAVRSVERHYPRQLKDAGIGGRVMVWVFIDTEGRVRNAQVSESSGNQALDEGALAAAWEFRFIPARYNEEVVRVWVCIPITFSVRR
jgi:TonB family protein